MVDYDPYNKPAIAYGNSTLAFRDANYAGSFYYLGKKQRLLTFKVSLTLTVIVFAATICIYFLKG